MKVILTRDVPKLGKDGEVVLVADGYARNYLFPRSLAIVAKGAAMKQHEQRIEREIAKSSQQLTEAQANGEKITGLQLQILAKSAPKSNRLFGSVTEADVAESIEQATGVAVDKRRISLIDPIKLTGTYELTARLHPDVIVPFTVAVVTPEQLEDRARAQAVVDARQAREAEAVRKAEEAQAAQAAQTQAAETAAENAETAA